MEKYATYRVFQNKETREIKRVLIDDEQDLEKTASENKWIELEEEPNETTSTN